MVDVDVRAVRSAARNVETNAISNAHVLLSDGTSDLAPRLRFDVVASNPPTHEGREVLEQLVTQSKKVLRPGGTMWLVVNRLLSVREIMVSELGNCVVVERKKGFVVLRSIKERWPENESFGPRQAPVVAGVPSLGSETSANR